jgi:cytoskeleton protein RodZ
MRGVTLEEISAATKISMRFLKALEAEDFPALPSGIFTRSFIRSYTKYLGLDEEPVLAEYQLAARPDADLDLNRMTVTKPPAQQTSPRAALLALFLAVAMLAGSYLLYRYSRSGGETQGKVISGGGVSAAPAPVPSQATEVTTAPVELTPVTATDSKNGASVSTGIGAGTAPENRTTHRGTAVPAGRLSPAAAARTPAAQNDLILQVAATEQAWVAVSADGKTTFQRILNPREFKTLKAKESFDVVTGNAQGIVLTLNGETLNPLGGHNVYKKIHLTHDDLKNPAP